MKHLKAHASHRARVGSAPRTGPLPSLTATSAIRQRSSTVSSRGRGSVTAASTLTSVTTAPAPAMTLVEEAPPAVSAGSEQLVELNSETFDAFLLAEGPSGLVMVDFYTDFCGPCKLALPHYEKLPQVFKKMRFAKFNCGDAENTAIASRHRVRSLPTFRLYRGGKPLEEITGVRPVQLRQMLIHFCR